MRSILPFVAGAFIAVAILVAFAPTSPVSVSPQAVAQAPAAAPPGSAPATPNGTGKESRSLRGGGSSDGSTGPNRPDAGTADSGDAAKDIREGTLQRQQRDRSDPLKPVSDTAK